MWLEFIGYIQLVPRKYTQLVLVEASVWVKHSSKTSYDIIRNHWFVSM